MEYSFSRMSIYFSKLGYYILERYLTYSAIKMLLVRFLALSVGGTVCVEISSEYYQVGLRDISCLSLDVAAGLFNLHKACFQGRNLFDINVNNIQKSPSHRESSWPEYVC